MLHKLVNKHEAWGSRLIVIFYFYFERYFHFYFERYYHEFYFFFSSTTSRDAKRAIKILPLNLRSPYKRLVCLTSIFRMLHISCFNDHKNIRIQHLNKWQTATWSIRNGSVNIWSINIVINIVINKYIGPYRPKIKKVYVEVTACFATE